MPNDNPNSARRATAADVSDQLLAAYLDGNATAAEMQQVLSALRQDPVVSETLRIALLVDDAAASPSAAIPAFGEDVLPMLENAACDGENLCGIACEAYVLTRRGIHCDLPAMLETARAHRWLKAEGTPLYAIGQLLAHEGLMVTRRYGATLSDIAEALACDNDVIVAVDGDKFHPGRPDVDDAPNHAVVVQAVAGDTVTVYDPDERQTLTLSCDVFGQAWRGSHNYLVRVLRTVADYVPHPIPIDDVDLGDDLEELQEAIAENAHEVWAAARMKEGWTYGPVRDDARRQHPDLVPYSALPDTEKEYDRLMARNTIRLVVKLGFRITASGRTH